MNVKYFSLFWQRYIDTASRAINAEALSKHDDELSDKWFIVRVCSGI